MQRPGAGKPARAKTPWQVRLEYLESLSLDAIVEEVNQERFAKLLCRLAAPSAREQTQMVRLLKLHEAGELTELPTDQRANAVRMRRLLIGLHRRCGMHPSCVIEIPRLASSAGLSPATCERAVRDLAEAQLVIADRERARPKRFGGQGPSSYQIVWSTITDLARSQGVQGGLFDLPPPCAGAPPHCAGAPPHSAGALPHKDRANARADVLSVFLFETSSPSQSLPGQQLSQAAAFPHLAEPSTAESAEEKKNLCSEGDWDGAAARLARYGVYFSRETAAKARRRGWSLDQVHGLLSACEAKRAPGPTGDVCAWPPGLVCRHLQLAPPGAPIALPPAEAFIRTKRDQALRAAEASALNQARRDAELVAARAQLDHEHEDRWGDVLEAMSEAERLELAEAVLRDLPFLRMSLRKGSGQEIFHRRLLQELERRAQTERS